MQREEQSGQDAGHQNAFGPQSGSEKVLFEADALLLTSALVDLPLTKARIRL